MLKGAKLSLTLNTSLIFYKIFTTTLLITSFLKWIFNKVIIKSNLKNYNFNFNRQSKLNFKDQPSITVRDEWRSFDLLPNESSKWAMYTKGPQTGGVQLMTVYETDCDWSSCCYNTILKTAIEIFSANEFLMGSLVLTEKNSDIIQLVLKPHKMVPQKYIQEKVVNPKLFKNDTTYTEKCKILRDFKVPFAIKAFQSDGPLAQIYILRDHKEIKDAKNIGIIISVNHIIADGATIFNLFKMFDEKSTVRSLNRTSFPGFTKELKETTRLPAKNGGDIFMANYIKLALPMMIKTFMRGKFPNKKFVPFLRNYKINETEVNKLKTQYNTNDFWVSTNDVLTYWLFKKKNPTASFVMMMVDLRQRLASVDKDLAGNYMSCVNLKLKDLKSPKTIRQCLLSRTQKETKKEKRQLFNPKSTPIKTHMNTKKIKNLIPIPDVQSPPDFANLLNYFGGISTNWTSFYSPVCLQGLNLQYQLPFIDEQNLTESKIFGYNLAIEDQMIIFKVNERETGIFVISGSGAIKPDELDADPMLNGKIM